MSIEMDHLDRLANDVFPGRVVRKDLVRRVKVVGPSGPSWRHGPRHVRGRGPRDTYG